MTSTALFIANLVVLMKNTTNSAGPPTMPGQAAAVTSPGAAAAPQGGQAGTIPQTTWLAGQAIEFDPATSAGLAILSAIGAGNLAPWVDGTSNVGHAALSN